MAKSSTKKKGSSTPQAGGSSRAAADDDEEPPSDEDSAPLTAKDLPAALAAVLPGLLEKHFAAAATNSRAAATPVSVPPLGQAKDDVRDDDAVSVSSTGARSASSARTTADDVYTVLRTLAGTPSPDLACHPDKRHLSSEWHHAIETTGKRLGWRLDETRAINALLACTRFMCAVATQLLHYCEGEGDRAEGEALWGHHLACLTALRMELNERALLLEMGRDSAKVIMDLARLREDDAAAHPIAGIPFCDPVITGCLTEIKTAQAQRAFRSILAGMDADHDKPDKSAKTDDKDQVDKLLKKLDDQDKRLRALQDSKRQLYDYCKGKSEEHKFDFDPPSRRKAKAAERAQCRKSASANGNCAAGAANSGP